MQRHWPPESSVVLQMRSGCAQQIEKASGMPIEQTPPMSRHWKHTPELVQRSDEGVNVPLPQQSVGTEQG